MKHMKILITGGSGLLGGKVAELLRPGEMRSFPDMLIMLLALGEQLNSIFWMGRGFLKR